MDRIRFIHTADVHLGSFLQIIGDSLPTKVEKSRVEATLEGFQRVCTTAIEEKVDFVVISGDLYDREARSVQAQEYFIRECRKLAQADIEVFVIAGNHDPLRENQDIFEFPGNVHVFRGEQVEMYEVLNQRRVPAARIVGQSYLNRAETQKIHLGYKVPSDHLWNIALLHTQLESGASNYVPATLSELKDKEEIHYWALGHLHQPQIISEDIPLVVYPGIPQGRDFGEQGRGGSFLVELSRSQRPSVTFLPTAPVQFARVDIFIDRDGDVETIDALREKIARKVEHLLVKKDDKHPLEGYVVDWVIRGRGYLHNNIMEQPENFADHLISELRTEYGNGNPFVWTNAVTFRTKPPLDFEFEMENSEILLELDAVLKEFLEEPEFKEEILNRLGPVWKGNVNFEDHGPADDFRFHLDHDTLQELSESARQMILEGLIQGRG